MVTRPTFPNKTNNPADAATIRKFFALEANEIKELLIEYADHIDILDAALGITIPTLTVGRFDSLPILQAAYPDGAEGAYAVIDDGLGTTPLVSIYNDISSLWEVATPDNPIIYVANEAALPGTGLANKLYLILDSGQFRYWFNSQYNVAGGAAAVASPVQYITNNGTKYRTIKADGLSGTNHEIGDYIDDWTDGTKTEWAGGEVLQVPVVFPSDFSDKAKFFRVVRKTRLT